MLGRLLSFTLLVLLLGSFPTGKSVQAAATSISNTQTCASWGTDVALTWKSTDSALQHYVYIGTGDSWAPGTYSSYGPVSGEARNLTIPGLTPSTYYYVVIASQLANGVWDQSEPSLLYTKACGAMTSYDASSVFYTPLTSTTYHATGSYHLNQQPIDRFVNDAILASFTPGRFPPLVNAYPFASQALVCDDTGCTGPFLSGFGVTSPAQGVPSTPGTTCQPYSGVCLTTGIDYDCAGGTGTGPFVTGPITLNSISNDPSGLDRDNDGTGCEAGDTGDG